MKGYSIFYLESSYDATIVVIARDLIEALTYAADSQYSADDAQPDDFTCLACKPINAGIVFYTYAD